MKKVLVLAVILLIMAVLSQCIMVPQRWPEYERRAEDRMFLLQQNISNGLAVGELSPNEARILLAKLEDIRRDYTVLRERRVTQEEWQALRERLDDLEREVNRVRTHPSRIDETKIEDRMIALQRRIDEGIIIGRLTRVQGREFQARLYDIRSNFLKMIKDRPFTSEEKAEISSRLDLLEREINRVW